MTPPSLTPTHSHALAETRAWLERAVIGLNLCPFAKAPWTKGQVRIVVVETDDPRALLEALCVQMRELAAADPSEVETTLVVHPQALVDFDDFNDFLDAADAALEDLELDGVLQLASFHPDYRFAGTEPEAIANATNRSPHPTLHLLREASVTRAVASVPDTDAIYQRNIATFEALGAPGWATLRAQCAVDAADAAEGAAPASDRPNAE